MLQVVYVFYQLSLHGEGRQYVRDETEATPYLLDLLHDRNTEVQRVCDATLQLIGNQPLDIITRVGWSALVKTNKHVENCSLISLTNALL